MKLDCLLEGKESYTKCGDDLGKLFHAGPKKIKKVLASKLNKRDPGYYGKGFYVCTSGEYAKEWYGPVVTEFEIDPKATVLWAGVDAKKVEPALFKAVVKNEKKLLAKRGNASKINEVSRQLKKNQVEWVHAVDRFAIDNKFDVVYFTPEEIVVKGHEKLTVVKTGAEEVQ